MEIKEILENLGYKLRDSGNGFWTTRAIYRDGDNQGALSIRKENGSFTDFVTNNKGSFKWLLKLTTGKKGKEFDSFFDNLEISIDTNLEPEIPIQKIQKKVKYPPEILDRLLPHYDLYTKSGISIETLKTFQVGLAQSAKLKNRYCFPVYDRDNNIIGFSGRWYKQIPPNGIVKYKHIGRKSDWIWPLHISEDYINEKRQVIIVESPNCILHLWDAGIRNILCLFGTSIGSKMFRYLIGAMNIDTIVISTNNEPDNHNRGLLGADIIKKKLDEFFSIEKALICLPTKKDFAIMSKKEILEWKESNLLN